MAYISKARKTEKGTANVPLFDDDGNVVNMISTVPDDSILFYADERLKTGFSDIAGQKVKMVCKIETADGIKSTCNIVTVINKLPNKVTVQIGDEFYNVASKIVNFIKIKDGE